MIDKLKNFFSEKYLRATLLYALLNSILINFIFWNFRAPLTSDSKEYLQTAQYFLGQAEPFLHRLLKPLMPALIGIFSIILGLKLAFLFLNFLLYIAIAYFIFKIIEMLFGNSRQAFIGSLFFLFSYPMLEYGMAYMTDLGGWLFFIFSVYLTLLFLRAPSYKLSVVGGFIAMLGFLIKESGGMGTLFFTICLFFIYKGRFSDKFKYFMVYSFVFLIPFSLWQLFVYLKFHYSYYDWFLFNRQGASVFKDEFWRLIFKSLAASFLFGWIFVVAGLVKIKNMPAEAKKISLALILPSFSFLLWYAASSRLFYIVGLLLSILASWGFLQIKFMQRKIFYISSLVLVLAGNYFWFVFDDKLRLVLNYFLNIHY